MMTRKPASWELEASELGLLKGAYGGDFGNATYGPLLRRQERTARIARTALDRSGELVFNLSDEFMHKLLLELDTPVYDKPDRFPNGHELMELVDDCKLIMMGIEKTQQSE